MSIAQQIPKQLALLATAVAVLGFTASAASAQEYTYSYRTGPGYYGPPPEEVIIEAPRYRAPQRSTIGAPIEDVAMSRTIRFDDLDLRTPWGARALRNRIAYTARTLCNRMDFIYPISTSDSPPCYRTAFEDGMAQADAAIAQARGYASEY
jgi:UrcA family protein